MWINLNLNFTEYIYRWFSGGWQTVNNVTQFWLIRWWWLVYCNSITIEFWRQLGIKVSAGNVPTWTGVSRKSWSPARCPCIHRYLLHGTLFTVSNNWPQSGLNQSYRSHYRSINFMSARFIGIGGGHKRPKSDPFTSTYR